jgi:hypothetical protein
MKFLFLAMSLMASTALAQSASVKDIPADGETTISISKGKGGTNEFQITDGEAEITGDPEVLVKAARNSWKKACDEWKKELRELNKDNQVLALSCNKPVCAKTGSSETLCESKGTYKLKIRVR